MSKIAELQELIKKDEEKMETIKKRIASRKQKIEELKSSEYLGILNDLNLSHEDVKSLLLSLKGEQEKIEDGMEVS
ncbi:MAG: hypothetical protein ACLSXM_12325 [Turicibacter sanguinis]|uniref:hypothetical protein n=1 Tax=Turicibacter sanguinis TaxID=154288 RepID=UPI0021D4C15A|nr:hypothetical protein [Turicibacter sanguinis]MCU7197978.1 hypothetical protein [Turicibacter sanguinis]MDB8576093.1 hypothetical protein [Turicibacter sanguinis]MDB8578898.1 hypothetical protein [Turicibacter sanguinis]MDB8584711.1 hypothetical protein [Turicibacter sanguinis]MDB8587658.1 hypothetical protein [Turicibacter sanguinis]